MKNFGVKVEEGREGKDGKPAVGPVYRNVLSKDEFPPLYEDFSTSWDLFRLKFMFCYIFFNHPPWKK